MKHALLLLLALAGISAAFVQGTFTLKPNPQNVVASRLEGVWGLNEELSHALGSPKDPKGFAFVRDEKVLERIPERFKAELGGDIYLAGTAQIDAQRDIPFVLTTVDGNPRVVFFRPAGVEKLGAMSGLNVMLCPALERRKDMLFVGGEKNDRPFTVYSRANLAPTK